MTSFKMMADKKRQITRNRTSYSCQKCRQRKVKCDKVHPVCGACQKNDEECVYNTGDQYQNVDEEPTVVDLGNAKKRKYASTVTNDGQGAHTSSVNLDDQISQLSTLLKQLSDIIGIEVNGAVVDSGTPNTITHSAARSELLTPDSQRSNLASSTTRHHVERSNHGADKVVNHQDNTKRTDPEAVLVQLEKLNNILRERHAYRVDEVLHRQNNTKSFLDGLEESDSPLATPTEEQRNVLFRSWLSCVFPVLPIIDPVEALLKYRELHFWYSYGLEKGIPNPVEDYVPVMFAIYYAGAMSISVRAVRKWFPGIARRRLLEMLKKQYLQCLKSPPELASGTAILTARIMMCYLCPESSAQSTMAGSAAASLIRTAHSCNLHRERFNESLDSASAELRRRIYWETFNLDTIEATGSNMPPSTNLFYCDTILMSEVKDSKLDTTEADEYVSTTQSGGPLDNADDPFKGDRSSMVSGIYVFLKAKTILASHARKLLDINLAARPKTKEDVAQMMAVLEQADRLVSVAVERFPTNGVPELEPSSVIGKPGQSFSMDHGTVFAENLVSNEIDLLCDLSSSSEKWQMPYVIGYRQSMASFYKWARIVLSMLLDQSHCFSFTPFLRNVKSRIWVQSRPCALKHSHSCLQKFNNLALDLELERFRWTWPRMFQPIHAAMIILIDAYERPHSREAPRSRALFDQTLSLTEPEYGIVGGQDGVTNLKPFLESGLEASTMLMQLRAKAWQKAGLDPSYLWTEEDQVKVGAASAVDDARSLRQGFREDRIPDHFTDVSDEQRQKSRARIFAQGCHDLMESRSDPDLQTATDDSICGVHASHLIIDQDQAMDKQRHRPDRFTQSNGLLRARFDQPRAPASDSTDDSTSKTSRSGYHYRFRPPSELYDVHELIRKIKNVQRMTKDANRLGKEAVRENVSAVSFQKEPSNQGSPPIDPNNFDDTVNKGNTGGKNTVHIDSLHAREAEVTSQTTSRATSSIHNPSRRNEPITDEPRQNPNFSTLSIEQSEQTTLPTQPALDFDWEKWDEVFGHLMDGRYDGDMDLTAYLDTTANNTANCDAQHKENGQEPTDS